MGDRKEIDNPFPARWQTGAEIKRRRTGNAGQSSRWGLHTGTARERETSADDAAPWQRECHTSPHLEWRAGEGAPTAERAARLFLDGRGVQGDPIMGISPGGSLEAHG